MTYSTEFRLIKEGNNFVYESPGFEEIFNKFQERSHDVTVKAYVSKADVVNEPTIEIKCGFLSNSGTYNRLRAYKLIAGKDLEVKVRHCGSLALEALGSCYIKAKMTIDSNVPLNEVIPKVLYVLHSDEIESIIRQAISFLQDKIKEVESYDS